MKDTLRPAGWFRIRRKMWGKFSQSDAFLLPHFPVAAEIAG
jgi:hypothetical protein